MVDFELVGFHAGLGMALADVDDVDLAAVARGGFAAVPAERVRAGARVVEHRLAAEEGVAILDVRLPAGLVPLRHAGARAEIVGRRLAAVRLGLVRRVLHRAVVPSRCAEVVCRLAGHEPVAAVHARLTELGRQVAWSCSGSGDFVRALFVAELVAAIWVQRASRTRRATSTRLVQSSLASTRLT